MTRIANQIAAGHRVIIKRTMRKHGADPAGLDHAALNAWARQHPQEVACALGVWFELAAQHWAAGNNSGDSATLAREERECDIKRAQAESVLALYGVSCDYPGLYPTFRSFDGRENYGLETLGRFLVETLDRMPDEAK